MRKRWGKGDRNGKDMQLEKTGLRGLCKTGAEERHKQEARD